MAYYHKGRFTGQIVALLSEKLIVEQMLKPASEVSTRNYWLERADGNVPAICEHQVAFALAGDASGRVKMVNEPFGKQGAEGPRVVARIPVKNTPFCFAMSALEQEVLGSKQPWHFTLALGLLSLLVAGSTIILWRFQTRNMLLNARLEETEKRESTIQEKNIRLEKEVRRRNIAELELRKYQGNLEQLVEERTIELKSTQKELVNKAIEAGRAQLSAMVLHNIGNAVTPLAVLMDSLNNNDIDQISFYLEKCRLELISKFQQPDGLSQNDSRTREVLAFLGELIGSLQQGARDRGETEDKIAVAVSYISEILTFQQNYAASENEIKSVVDLNAIIKDAIRMQAVSLEKRGIAVLNRLSSDPPRILVDKNRLMQLIVNIIKNGYEAIDQNEDESAEKVMTFCTIKQNGYSGFSIQDSGAGADEETIRHLFDFGHSGKGSSGFGLYYCKMFVEANQGWIEFKSKGSGRGAKVKVWFESAGRADESPGMKQTGIEQRGA